MQLLQCVGITEQDVPADFFEVSVFFWATEKLEHKKTDITRKLKVLRTLINSFSKRFTVFGVFLGKTQFVCWSF